MYYFKNSNPTITRIPAIIADKCHNDSFREPSFCNSGIRLEPAMYINAPAENGTMNGTNKEDFAPRISPTIAPAIAVVAERKL